MDSRFSLSGRVALVTGGTKGMGRAIAEELARAGAAVGIIARTQTDLDRAAEELRAHGTNVVAVRADAMSGDEIRAAVDEVSRRLGPISVLVNNVGGSSGPGFGGQALLDIDDAGFDRCFQFNVKSHLYAAQAVVPGMRELGKGSIINVASLAGRPFLMPWVNRATYSMAKISVIQLTNAMALEWAPTIRANCIAPGQVLTEGGVTRASEQLREKVLGRMALGRAGSADDVAGAALFLASDASSWITGVTIDVNGGAGMVPIHPFT